MRRSFFFRFSKSAANTAGHPWTFGLAVLVVSLWAVTGPIFHFSDTWQLVINTSTTIVTFLMVFLIQNTQNRDILAVHLKLNELIRATEGAHNSLMEIENLSDEELQQIDNQYKKLSEITLQKIRVGKKDIGCPDIPKLKQIPPP